jgi:hypothetical protein
MNETTKPSNPKDIVGIRKAPMSTVPANVMAELGVAMLEGGAKYGRHNYRAVGVRASVYYDGTMRHLMAWWEGEDIDPDTMDVDENGQVVEGTGVSHITKAIASLTVLRDAMLQGMWEDDRPPRAAPFFPTLNKRAAGIVDRYKDRAPRHYTIEDTFEPLVTPEFLRQTRVEPEPNYHLGAGDREEAPLPAGWSSQDLQRLYDTLERT